MGASNTSGYTGVSFQASCGKYQAHVGYNGKLYFCGRYNNPEMAAAARQNLISAHPEWGFTARHGQ